MNKNADKIIGVKLSSSFPTKSRCKFCKGFPKVYYMTRNPTHSMDHRKTIDSLDFYRSFIKRMSDDFFLISQPRYFQSASTFAHAISNYCNYRPRLHRTRGCTPKRDYVEFLACECGKTFWAFAVKSVKNRPEIENRKSKNNFPNKGLII